MTKSSMEKNSCAFQARRTRKGQDQGVPGQDSNASPKQRKSQGSRKQSYEHRRAPLTVIADQSRRAYCLAPTSPLSTCLEQRAAQRRKRVVYQFAVNHSCTISFIFLLLTFQSSLQFSPFDNTRVNCCPERCQECDSCESLAYINTLKISCLIRLEQLTADMLPPGQ